MNVAIDVGGFRIRSLALQDGRLVSRSSRSTYAALPDHHHQRWLLERAEVPFSRCEGHLVFVADDALRVAESFSVPLRPLLAGGQLPQHDPLARQILAALIEQHLPLGAGSDATCAVITPSGTPPSGDVAQFVQRTLTLQGYRSVALSSAEALVLAEMESHLFTGITLVFGASGSEMVLAHNGRTVVRTATSLGGDWLDEQLAASKRNILWSADGRPLLNIEAARRERDEAAVDADDSTHALLRDLSLDLIRRLIEAAGEALARDSFVRKLSQPLTALVGGGLASAHGFVPLVSECLARAAWPIEVVPEVRAVESPHAILRGGVIRAELEECQTDESARPVAA